MHPMSLRQRPDRQPPPVAIPPDLLAQLHPRSHSFCHPSSQLQEAKTLGQPSDGGGANSTCRSGANSECRTQLDAVPEEDPEQAAPGHREEQETELPAGEPEEEDARASPSLAAPPRPHRVKPPHDRHE